jgi:hypothetical protein
MSGTVEEEIPMIRQAAAVVVALCLSASPLHAQNAPNTRLTVSEASADVHKTPSVGSPVIGKAPRGTELVVTREVGDWMKVSWPSSPDGAGYVRKSSLTRASAAAPTGAKAPATATAAPAKTAPASTTAKTAAAPKTATTAKPAAGARTATTAKGAPATATAKTTAEPAVAPVTAKAAVSPTPTAAPVAVRTEQIPVAQPSAPSPARTLYVAPTHAFGVGAFGGSRGLGGSARAWKKGRLGMQLEFSRYNYDSVDMLSRASVTDIAPGVLFALNDRVTDTLWLRPYLGVAGHFARSSRTDLIFADTTESANTFGARAFVGSELSLSSLPALAISMDVGYYHQPEPFIGFEPGGVGFSVAAHWYVK